MTDCRHGDDLDSCDELCVCGHTCADHSGGFEDCEVETCRCLAWCSKGEAES